MFDLNQHIAQIHGKQIEAQDNGNGKDSNEDDDDDVADDIKCKTFKKRLREFMSFYLFVKD